MVTNHDCPTSSAKCIFVFLEHKNIYFINISSKILGRVRYISVQFSRWVMPDSLQPHGLKHVRLPCPSTTPRACSNSCPLSRWCHPTISSSLIPLAFSWVLQKMCISLSSKIHFQMCLVDCIMVPATWESSRALHWFPQKESTTCCPFSSRTVILLRV